MSIPDGFSTASDYFGAAHLEAAERAVRALGFRDALLTGSSIVGRLARHISPYPCADTARDIAILSARLAALAPATRGAGSTIGNDVEVTLRYIETLRELLAVARSNWRDLGSGLEAAADLSGSSWQASQHPEGPRHGN